MNQSTRISLLRRLKNQEDSLAWSQFVDIYGPLIYRFGRRKGLQDADATDLMQDVFRQVAQSIADFNYNPEIGRFRSWLFVVARNSLNLKIKKSIRQVRGSGDSGIAEMLAQVPTSSDDDSVWEREYREHLFGWACEQIKHQFSESTWRAFSETAVKGQIPADVAKALNISVGAVYIAKTRVTQKLKAKIATIDESI